MEDDELLRGLNKYYGSMSSIPTKLVEIEEKIKLETNLGMIAELLTEKSKILRCAANEIPKNDLRNRVLREAARCGDMADELYAAQSVYRAISYSKEKFRSFFSSVTNAYSGKKG